MTRAESRPWYAFVSARPTPELDERVHVGIVVGNGSVSSLRYAPRVPRLSGLVASDELGVYDAMLADLQERVAHGLPFAELASLLGSQLVLSDPIALPAYPSDAELAWLVSTFLCAPRIPYVSTDRQIMRRSARRLHSVLERVRPAGSEIRADQAIDQLYEASLVRRIEYHVPKVSRVLRGRGRDLLIHSATVEMQPGGHVIAPGIKLASRAFFAYRELAPMIAGLGGYQTRRIGVLHASRDGDSPDVRHEREYAKHDWSKDATVIDGAQEDVDEALRAHAAWVAETL